MTEPGSDTVVVPESRWQRDGLYGLLTAAFVAALVRGLVGATTAAGRVAVGVVFGVVLVVVVAGWVRALRHPDRLEVSADTIRYVSGAGKVAHPVLTQQAGEELRFVARRAGRLAFLALNQPATSMSVQLRMFDRKTVRKACEARGWRFATA